jgi:phosphoribosylformylglycinamidine synthase
MLQQIEANRQVILRYTDPDGRVPGAPGVDDKWNPNGSVNAIAGICSERRNVFGMMPHPERACEALLGGTDGRVILESLVAAFAGAR